MFKTLIFAYLYLQLVTAHMEMVAPLPIRSQIDPDVQNKDYDYKVPLSGDGANFPCKLYQNDSPQVSKATYTAGQSYQMKVAGAAELSGGSEDATHGGGSCQLSLSYDNGQSFRVIKSIIGGCPIQKTYSFTIPSIAPSSDSTLFAWTWFNRLGNREMYMNCARVTIQGSSSAKRGRYERKRQSALSSLPEIYKCNIGAKGNGCTTTAGEDVHFPNPGPDVKYGQDSDGNQQFGPGGSSSSGPDASTTSGTSGNAASSGHSSASSSGDTNLSPNGSSNGSSNGESSNISASPSASENEMLLSSSNPETPATASSTFILVSSSALATPATTPATTPYPTSNHTSHSSGCKPKTTSAPATTPAPATTSSATSYSVSSKLKYSTASAQSSAATSPGVFASGGLPHSPMAATSTQTSPTPSANSSFSASCSPGALRCDSSTAFSQCTAGGTYISMGSVPAGMQCVDGKIVRQNKGPCQTEGAITCGSNGETYMVCVDGGLMDMGSVAAGTQCADGKIGPLAGS